MNCFLNLICSKIRRLLSGTVFILFVLAVSAVFAQDIKPVTPGRTDRCPACGMFVAKYPHWVAEIKYKDGTTLFFDGTKDLFKYYFEPAKFKSDRQKQDIEIIYVTEYYSVSLIEATSAFYVAGSDVYGPMGRELIPFGTEADAREFLKDHKGKRIVTFDEVTPVLIYSLD